MINIFIWKKKKTKKTPNKNLCCFLNIFKRSTGENFVHLDT